MSRHEEKKEGSWAQVTVWLLVLAAIYVWGKPTIDAQQRKQAESQQKMDELQKSSDSFNARWGEGGSEWRK